MTNVTDLFLKTRHHSADAHVFVFFLIKGLCFLFRRKNTLEKKVMVRKIWRQGARVVSTFATEFNSSSAGNVEPPDINGGLYPLGIRYATIAVAD
jgi:hypothetical protein